MPGVLILIIFVVLVFVIISSSSKLSSNKAKPKNRKRKIDYTQELLPIGLGFQAKMPLQALEQRMEQGMSVAFFLDQLKQRVMTAHPNMNSAEYEWKLLELKRYLAMNAILRQVPMFSEAVDDIWHEMLMFTREYQQLTERVTGAMVHHSPHVQKQSLPHERAWFDWVYGHLFEFTPFSSLIWNPFYKFPLSPERIQQLRELDEQEIIERLFNARAVELFPEIKTAIQSLIQQAKEQIDAAEDPQQSFSQNSGTRPLDYMGYAAGAMIFYSVMDTGNNVANGSYESNMTNMLPEEEQNRNDGTSSSCSSCGTGGDGGSSCSSDGGSHDSGGGGSDGGGNDGGGSGCSSSSCSSGCGGGGD